MKKRLGVYGVLLLAAITISGHFLSYSVASAAVTAGLISEYKFDENSGSIASDSVGSNNGTLINSPSWVVGKINSALSFNGNSSYVNIPDDSSLEPSQISVSFWIKRNGPQTDWSKILIKGSGGSAPYSSYKFEFNGSSDEQLYFAVGFTDNTSSTVVNNTPLLDNRWYFITGTYDGTKVRLYVNGMLENTAYVSKTIKYDTVPLTMGAGPGYGFFSGSIDNVKIYNRGLSAEEVQSIYNETFIPNTAPTNSVSVTYPLNGQMVYGPINVTALAQSSTQVVGVQFKLDGNNLGAEDTTPPYSVALNPATLSLGTHTLSAVQRNSNDTFTNSSVIYVNVAQPQAIYASSSATILNPERGFYTWTGFWPEQANTDFNFVRSNGFTLSRPYIRLDQYATSSIPQSFLNNLSAQFQKARNAGIKVIPRISYNFEIGSPDASLNQIQSHISQLAPIFSANEDVISSFEAGYIGAWGEWHHSTNGLDNINAKSDVLNSLLSALPSSRMVALRYPYDMQALNGPAITKAEAFSGTNRARVGSHQDCFLASTDDWGTWGQKGQSIAFEKNYIAENGLYSVVGGETCNPNPPRSECTVALAELEQMHWSYINEDYEPNVIMGWKLQGCYDEIARRLGYRYVLSEGYYPSSVNIGDNMHVQFTIDNQGYASLFNARPIYLVLQDQSGINTYVHPLSNDIRLWAPGTRNTISADIPVNTGTPAGVYNLYLWLPDSSQTIKNNALYSIQLANQNVWNPSNGYNTLATGIVLTSGQVTPTPTATLSAVPSNIVLGSSSTLSWSTTNANFVSIDNGIGQVSTTGQMLMSPVSTTTYILTAVGNGTTTKNVTINVTLPFYPLAQWKMNEGVGSTTSDSSGNGYTGTLLNGAVWATGYSGSGVSFDGVNDYVNIGTNSVFNVTSDLTITAWVNHRTQRGPDAIVSKGGCYGRACPFSLRISGSGNVCLDQNNGQPTQDSSCTTATVPLNVWKHIAVTRTLNNLVKIYIDGVLVTTRTASRSPASNTFQLIIGNTNPTGDSPFDGVIDDLRIFRKVLSASEIQQVMSQP